MGDHRAVEAEAEDEALGISFSTLGITTCADRSLSSSSLIRMSGGWGPMSN